MVSTPLGSSHSQVRTGPAKSCAYVERRGEAFAPRSEMGGRLSRASRAQDDVDAIKQVQAAHATDAQPKVECGHALRFA